MASCAPTPAKKQNFETLNMICN